MKESSQECPHCRFTGDHIVIAVNGKSFTRQCKNCGKQFCSPEPRYRLWKQFVRAQGSPEGNTGFIHEESDGFIHEKVDGSVSESE